MPENLSANNHEAAVGGSCEGAFMSQAVLPDTARRTAPAWLAWAGLGVVYVVWGSTYLAIRFTVESMPPLVSGGLRFLIAGSVLLLAVLVIASRGALRMDWKQLGSGR